MNFMRQILFICFLFCSQLAYSQFGLSVKTQFNNYDKWDEVARNAHNVQDFSIFSKSYEVSLDYWLRLKEHRIEFYPEISYQTSNNNRLSISTSVGTYPFKYQLWSVGVGVNTHIYFLDLVGDCNCPTFSKQNPFFKKGIFVLLGVKEYYQSNSITIERKASRADFTLQLSGGIGIDIGITDLLTITPFATTVYFPSTTWDGISASHGIIHVLPPDESTSNLTFQIGLRFGFRPDYLKNR